MSGNQARSIGSSVRARFSFDDIACVHIVEAHLDGLRAKKEGRAERAITLTASDDLYMIRRPLAGPPCVSGRLMSATSAAAVGAGCARDGCLARVPVQSGRRLGAHRRQLLHVRQRLELPPMACADRERP